MPLLFLQRKNLQGEAFLWQRDVTADPPEDVGEVGIQGLQPAAANNVDEFTMWLHCLAAYFQIGTAQKSKGLEALERAKACVPADSPLLLLCSARVAELQGHNDDALHLYTSAAACSTAAESSHPLIRYHSPELYLGRWYNARTPLRPFWCLMNRRLLCEGKAEVALSWLQRAVAIDGRNHIAWMHLCKYVEFYCDMCFVDMILARKNTQWRRSVDA
jgi:hypothetical protein